VVVENLYKNFGRTVALKNISIVFRRGFNIVMGPNASGKSTLIRILAGVLKPSSGRVRVFGYDPWISRRFLMKRVSVIYDVNPIPMDVSGYSLAKFYSRMKDGDLDRFMEICRRLKIDEFLYRDIRTYSKGTLNKYSLSLILMCNSDLYILDEPFSNIDRESILVVVDLLHEELDKGKSIIVASHIPFQKIPPESNIVFMYNGEVVEMGLFRELSYKYSLASIRIKNMVYDELNKYVPVKLLDKICIGGEGLEIFSRHADNIIRILEKNGIKYAEIYPDLGEMYLKIVLKRIMLSR